MLICCGFSPAKPSRPSRAYVQVAKQEHINAFSEKVCNTSFIDAKSSTKDGSLLGPPSVDFAPFGRVPNGRPRKDARQGTIDQDPEFIDFLESLTNPVAKHTLTEQENEGVKGKEKVTVTPLVQFLKDKKANKGKENPVAKNAKQTRHEKDGKTVDSKPVNQTVTSPKKRSAQAVKVEQAARDAVKVLNKQAANVKGAASAPPASKPQTTTQSVLPNSTANAALANKQRERGSISAAAKILQRDLGIGNNQRGRGGRHGMPNAVGRPIAGNNLATNKPNAGASLTSQAAPATAPTASDDTPQQTSNQPPTGPAAIRAASSQPTVSPSPHTAPSRPVPAPSTSTQAFLKHANPSQGITEPLLEDAFMEFGTINKVEIDKKKGFAYVDFADPESLQKAIKASPIKVAQGQVQVLERKTGPTLQARNVLRGGNPMIGNSNAGRGSPIMGNSNARVAGPMAGKPPIRGGSPMIGNRGGMPMGGRGGSMRGRGSMARGGANMPPTIHAKKTHAPSAPSTISTGSPIAASTAEPETKAAPASPNPAPSESVGT